MSFKQAIVKAYEEWQKDEKRIGVTSTNFRGLYSKMEKLKRGLCAFADKFDKEFVGADKFTGELAQDMYESLRDDFVGKILEARKFIIFRGVDKNFCAAELKYFNECFDELKNGFEKSKNLFDFFKSIGEKFLKFDLPSKYFYYDSSDELKMHNEANKPMYAACFLTHFLHSVFYHMHKYFYVIQKTIANDKEYFYDENDSNRFSRAIRHLFPNLWSDMAQGYDKHTIEPVSKSVKIFPQGKPLPREVQQAAVGDCYLVAALISLAKKKPKVIEDCFVQGIDKIESEENIDIRLFAKISDDIRPIIITVNRGRVIAPKQIKDGALWPKLIEKAYAVYRKKYNPTSKKLDGGTSGEVYFALTGNKGGSIFTSGGGMDRADISDIKSELDNNQAVTCSFKRKFVIKDAKRGGPVLILSRHAYAITGIMEKGDPKNKTNKDYVRLVEPNKALGRSKIKNRKSKEGGHIAMAFDKFLENVDEVEYTTD